jgi:hypothetical protein
MGFFGIATLGFLSALLPISSQRAWAAEETSASASAMAAAQPVAPATAAFPAGVNEVLKLQKGGVPADIIVHYINNSPLSFYLSADNVIYLQQQGVSAQVITTMIQRNGEQQRQTALAYQQGAAAAPSAPATYGYPPENPAQNFNNALQARAADPAYYPAPAPSYPVYYPSYADYGYYPYYPYAYDFWPPVVVGLGFGHVGGGFVHGGFGGHGIGGGFGGGHGGGHR